MMVGRINEIFSSVQGEGIYFGERQVFVRFSDCNLSCAYCDTGFNKYEEYDCTELIRRIKAYGQGFHSVSFTGGEPLLQKDFLKECLYSLKKDGYTTYLETNGTLAGALSEVINEVDIIAMDLKLPSSGDSPQGYWQEHRQFLSIAIRKDVFVKIVIASATTRDDFIKGLDLLKSSGYYGVLVLQPNSLEPGGSDQLEGRLEQFKGLCGNYGVIGCVIPQMHKIMGVR